MNARKYHGAHYPVHLPIHNTVTHESTPTPQLFFCHCSSDVLWNIDHISIPYQSKRTQEIHSWELIIRFTMQLGYQVVSHISNGLVCICITLGRNWNYDESIKSAVFLNHLHSSVFYQYMNNIYRCSLSDNYKMKSFLTRSWRYTL